ncbi:MAG: hypothetical protein SF052_02220 [Bacteroidia bacterium]|nr:hypothetical protein [Bacteroidia bacterium]
MAGPTPETQPESPIPGRFASPEKKNWREYLLKTRQEEPARLEEAAKFLAGMISISLSIFLDINETAFAGKMYFGWVATGIGLWLLSLLSAFLVLFPWNYRYSEDAIATVEEMHRRVVRIKRTFLIAATMLFTTALVILSVVYVVRIGSI